MFRHISRQHTRTVAITLTLAGTLALSACGGDDTKGGLPGLPGGSTGQDITLPGDLPVVPGAQGDAESGFCHVEVSGDVNAEWTAPGGYSAVGYGPWVPEATAAASPIATDDTFFLVNCTGENDNYVGFGANLDQHIPMAPGTYTIPTAQNAFGVAGPVSPIGMLITLGGTDTNWGPSQDGTLIITAFDEEHIAGTFSVTVSDVLADLGGTPSKGSAVITGEFDFANPN